LTVIGNIAIYSYAATYGINCLFDNSEPKVYQAKVIIEAGNSGIDGDKLVMNHKLTSGLYIVNCELNGAKKSQKLLVKLNSQPYQGIAQCQFLALDFFALNLYL